MIILISVGQFHITRLALDVQIALVPIVKAVGQCYTVAFVYPPAHPHFGAYMAQILSVLRCATGV